MIIKNGLKMLQCEFIIINLIHQLQVVAVILLLIIRVRCMVGLLYQIIQSINFQLVKERLFYLMVKLLLILQLLQAQMQYILLKVKFKLSKELLLLHEQLLDKINVLLTLESSLQPVLLVHSGMIH